ncbi:MAG: NADH-quinone oxidoreductase subunit J [Anaerolineales bacterium]
MSIDLILFLGLALVVILSAAGMLFSRNAIYSALFLIINFSTIAIYYLILGAPFIALTQITVYAGAIMVLFLFVIMLLGAEQTGRTPASWWMQPMALGLGALLMVESLYLIYTHLSTFPQASAISGVFGNPVQVGEILFDKYLLPFEAISLLLLAAMIGAIVLTKKKIKR